MLCWRIPGGGERGRHATTMARLANLHDKRAARWGNLNSLLNAAARCGATMQLRTLATQEEEMESGAGYDYETRKFGP